MFGRLLRAASRRLRGVCGSVRAGAAFTGAVGLGSAAVGLGVYGRKAVEAKAIRMAEYAKDLKLEYALRKNKVLTEDGITLPEARSILKDYYPYFSWLSVSQDAFLGPYFDLMDTDGDGVITSEEMADLVKSLNGNVNMRVDSNYSDYVIIAGPGMEDMAKSMAAADPVRFTYIPTKWRKFPDESDYIEVGGFHPVNRIHDRHVLFLASFHNNDVTLSQYHVLTMLAESFPKDLTICLPFYPTATMERVSREGICATANTTARFFSGLPSSGRPHRLMVYDLHTLQNRFYLSGKALATLHTAFPLVVEKIPSTNIDCVAFPDDGAEKRFRKLFQKSLPHLELIVCGKKRDPKNPSKRTVVIKDGNAKGKNVVIVDDMIQSGGTMTECAKALKRQGAQSVSAFCTHGVFPQESYKRFLRGGDRAIFDRVWVTNSNPVRVRDIPKNDNIEVLDISELIIKDL